ncbi:Uncharacterised protein [Cedecea neteri]|uniref:Uncharacterized protein n=1 Tax=Cedecea neteri TaxID=158822 RepID=A0A2X3JE78_9ENTR|nr:Uncharacterised protein [Cedecea neteri]
MDRLSSLTYFVRTAEFGQFCPRRPSPGAFRFGGGKRDYET